MQCKSTNNKTLVLYSYFEKNDEYAQTFQYFLDVGVAENDGLQYVFVIQGGNCSVMIPRYENVIVLKRPNTCMDFGAYSAAIEHLGGNEAIEKFDFFLFINPSAVGPILPKYWPAELHWSTAFTSRLTGNVHAVGPSLVCLPPSDLGGHGPRLETFMFAATLKAVQVALDVNTVFTCHASKAEAIVNGEYGFSRALLSRNMNMDTLLMKYSRLDWSDKINWNCNRNRHPTRMGTYDEGLTVSPLETVFYKPKWSWDGKVFSEPFLNETLKYMSWTLERKKMSLI
jgi:hypothetical protein